MLEQRKTAEEMLRIPTPNFDSIEPARDRNTWLKRWVIYQNVLRIIAQEGFCKAKTLKDDEQFLNEITNIRGKSPDDYVKAALHQDLRKIVDNGRYIEKTFKMPPWLHKIGNGQSATYYAGPDSRPEHDSQPVEDPPEDSPPKETVTLSDIVDGGAVDDTDPPDPELQEAANLEGDSIPDWLKVPLRGLSKTLEGNASSVTILGSLININLHYHAKK